MLCWPLCTFICCTSNNVIRKKLYFSLMQNDIITCSFTIQTETCWHQPTLLLWWHLCLSFWTAHYLHLNWFPVIWTILLSAVPLALCDNEQPLKHLGHCDKSVLNNVDSDICVVNNCVGLLYYIPFLGSHYLKPDCNKLLHLDIIHMIVLWK